MTVSEAWNMRCPSCGLDTHLDVEVKTTARLTSDGTDCEASVEGDHIWDDRSPCSCAACDWRGTARDAEIPDDEDKCRTCGAEYEDGGDGFDGECPSCADKTDQRLYPENYE